MHSVMTIREIVRQHKLPGFSRVEVWNLERGSLMFDYILPSYLAQPIGTVSTTVIKSSAKEKLEVDCRKKKEVTANVFKMIGELLKNAKA